jgi:hypothetical protein
MLNLENDISMKLESNPLMKIIKKNKYQLANASIENRYSIKTPNKITLTGKRIINNSIDLNFNSTSIKDLKYKLDKISHSTSNVKKLTSLNTKSLPENNIIKSPILMRSSNQQGVKYIYN